jgi:hypothetical protein
MEPSGQSVAAAVMSASEPVQKYPGTHSFLVCVAPSHAKPGGQEASGANAPGAHSCADADEHAAVGADRLVVAQ